MNYERLARAYPKSHGDFDIYYCRSSRTGIACSNGAFDEQAMPVPYQITPRAYLFG